MERPSSFTKSNAEAAAELTARITVSRNDVSRFAAQDISTSPVTDISNPIRSIDTAKKVIDPNIKSNGRACQASSRSPAVERPLATNTIPNTS